MEIEKSMGTQSKIKSTKITNMGLPFRRYSMPETVMRKYSLKRQRSVQSPTEFGLLGTKDQGCQTDLSVFTGNLDLTPTRRSSNEKVSPFPLGGRLGVTSDRTLMRCSRCNRSSERRHSYSCKYSIICSKCKHSWRKTSLPVPVSIVSVSKGSGIEIHRKSSEMCREKPILQSGSSPENRIQFDIGKIIERSSDIESDFSREADTAEADSAFRQLMAETPTVVESELIRLEPSCVNEDNRLDNNLEKLDTGDTQSSDITTERATDKMFEDKILKMLDTYCPHMQCTLNMFMGAKRPHSEGSVRSQTSSELKRPKSASARLPSNHDRNKPDLDSAAETSGHVKNQNGIGPDSMNGNFIEFHAGDSHTGTQNILIIDHDNISSTENTPGSTTRECDSCRESCPKCCSQNLSDDPRSASCCCTSPDTTIEMKTSSGSGVTSSSGTLDQTVSDHTGSTQDSTLSITSVTPEDKAQKLKSTSPLPIVLSSESILMNPIIPETDDLDTTGSSQLEETRLEPSDSPFPTVINSETTLMEPLEKGYVSKKDMHNYSVHFLDSGHSDSSDDVRKQEKERKSKLNGEGRENTQKSDESSLESKIIQDKLMIVPKISEDAASGVNGSASRLGELNGKTERPRRDRRKSTFCLKVPPESQIPEEEKADVEIVELSANDLGSDQKVTDSLGHDLSRDKRRISMCGTDSLNMKTSKKVNDESLVEILQKKSSQESQDSVENKSNGRSNKVDMCTQCSGNFEPDEPNGKHNNGILKKEMEGKRKNRREKREAKLAEVNDMVKELEMSRQMPISTISASTYYEGEGDEFLVPRYSAAPSSISMFVNTSSEYSSDSDLSFADSLEDRLSPLPANQLQTEFTRYDNRLVRGEVTEIKMINECKHKRRMKKCYAYFVTLSGEQTSISVTTMPESLRNRLIMKEKQIRYHCRRKHPSGRVHCKRSVHRLCSRHRAKQKQTQTSPPCNDLTVKDTAKTTSIEPITSAMATSTPKTETVKTVTTTAVATLMTPTEAVSKSVQTIQNGTNGEKRVSDDQENTIENYDRIMIGFCSNNVETSIYYSQDIKTVKNAAEIKREVSINRPKGQSNQNDPHHSPDHRNSGYKNKDQEGSRSSRRNVDIDEEICQILLAGLEDQNSGRMAFVEEKQTFYSKSNVRKISSSAQTLEEVKDTATLTDLSYDCQKADRIANNQPTKPTSDANSGNKKLTALQKSEETLEKLQKINESLRKEIQEAKLRCNQGTQVNLDNRKQESESETNGNSYGSLLHHSSNFKQANFTEYRRLRPEPSKSSNRAQASKTNNRLAPPKGVSKRASNLIGSKFRQKFEAIPEEKSSGSFDSTEDSADVTPREKNENSGVPLFPKDVGGNIKICRSATDCRMHRNDINDQFLTDQQRRHTIGNLVVNDPSDVVYERSTERRRNTIHGNVSVSNTQTLVNTEHLKRSGGNLNMNVSRRTGHQIIGKRTSMMVGRFEQVKNGDGTKMSHLEKYKGRAALETDEQEELLTLSRGWINFYLLRGDSQEVTSENGIHEEVIGRTHSVSPADYLDQQTSSQKTTSGSSPEDQIGQYTVHIHAAPEPGRHNVKFPGVGFTSTPSNRNTHLQSDEIILPEIASPPQSSPSTATPSRSPLQPKIDPQTLPSLSLPNGMRKSRKSRHNGGSSLNFKHTDEQRVPGLSPNYDADLSPPNTPKSIMSRSGELACSEQSITSSSCGSESPKFLTNKRWSCHRHRKNLSASANSWTVTVAGNQEAASDVEMKLAFSHSQQDKQRTIGSSSQQWTLTVNSGKQDRTLEKPRHENFHCLPDLDVHNHIHKKGWKWKDETPPSTAEQFSLLWPAVQEIIEKNMILQNSARLDPTWCPEKTEEVRSNLSVTGWAITPEKKPRVPTQSERDLTRAHCPRVIKQRQYNFA